MRDQEAREAQEALESLISAVEDEERALYFYPSGVSRFICSSDNYGYPTCMGDGSMCHYSEVLETQVCKYVKDDA